MLILSFRDMSLARCGGVTPGIFYDLPNVGPALNWWQPPPPLTYIPDASPIVAGKHVCFLVHGFNVDRDEGYTGFGAFSQELAGLGALGQLNPAINLLVSGVDMTIPVLWPGDWYLPANYPFLLPEVRQTGRYFAQLLLGATTRISRVSFVTHSMGVRVALEAMQQTLALAANSAFRAPLFETVIFTAPAASDQILDDPDYDLAVTAMQRIVVVSSRADTVLEYAFPLGNAAEQALWPRDPGADDALGRYGPRLAPDSKALGKTSWYEIPLAVDQNHSDYVPAPWQPVAGYANGWSDKRVRIGKLAKAVIDGGVAIDPLPTPVVPRSG